MKEYATLNIENVVNKIYITLTNTYGDHTSHEYVFIELIKFIDLWKKLNKNEGTFIRVQTITSYTQYEKWLKLEGKTLIVAYGAKNQKTEKDQTFNPDLQITLNIKTSDFKILNAISTMDKDGIRHVRSMRRYNPRPSSAQYDDE